MCLARWRTPNTLLFTFSEKWIELWVRTRTKEILCFFVKKNLLVSKSFLTSSRWAFDLLHKETKKCFSLKVTKGVILFSFLCFMKGGYIFIIAFSLGFVLVSIFWLWLYYIICGFVDMQRLKKARDFGPAPYCGSFQSTNFTHK